MTNTWTHEHVTTWHLHLSRMLHGVDWNSVTVSQGRHIGSFEGWTDMFDRNAYNKLPTYVASHSGRAWLTRRRKFEIQRICQYQDGVLQRRLVDTQEYSEERCSHLSESTKWFPHSWLMTSHYDLVTWGMKFGEKGGCFLKNRLSLKNEVVWARRDVFQMDLCFLDS